MNNQHGMSGSNHQITYEEAVNSLPAYALGALEPDEMLAVEQHLQDHPDLQQQLDSLTETVTALAHSAPPMAAPARVKSSILSRARSALQEEADSANGAPSSAPVANGDPSAPAVPDQPRVQTIAMPPISNAPAESSRTVVRPDPPPWWAWIVRPRTWQLASAALALVLALVTVTAVQLRNLAVDLQAQLNAAEQRLAELETINDELATQQENTLAELAALRSQLSNQDFRLTLLNNQLDLLVDPERVIPLALNDPAAGEDVRGSFYAAGDSGVLLLEGLATLPADQTYEFWLIPDEGDAAPAGLFNAAADTDVPLTIWNENLPLAPDEYNTVGISIEPAGGSPSPTGPIVLLGSQT